MGRKEQFIRFDLNKYKADLKRALKAAVKQSVELVYEQIITNLNNIPFKDNPVRVLSSAGGSEYETSDEKRKAAIYRNLEKALLSVGQSHFKAAVWFTTHNYKESHIGIYYEYGTGSGWDGVHSVAPDFSSSRSTDRRIASRSRHIDYSGHGNGTWIDMGGNLRITGSKKAGQVDEGFRSYVGQDIIAMRWFRQALADKRQEILALYKNAVRKVNPVSKDYLIMKSKFVLGKD